MKTRFALVALFAASHAFASGTSIGNGRVNCREGATDTLLISNGEAGSSYETYTCRRGQWVNLMAPPAKPVKRATCREGQIERFPGSYESGGQLDTTFVCHNGQFVPVNR